LGNLGIYNLFKYLNLYPVKNSTPEHFESSDTMTSVRDTDPSLRLLEEKFKGIGLHDKLLAEAIKSKFIRASLDKTIDEAPEQIPDDPTIAALLLSLATATQKGHYESRPKIIKAIIDGRIKSVKQVDGNHLLPKT